MRNIQEIFDYPLLELQNLINSNEAQGIMENLSAAYKNIIEQRFKSTQTGISRKDISVWGREDLLLHSPKEEGWKKYSIIECMWMRTVASLKKFGVGKQGILAIKAALINFDSGKGMELFQSAIETSNTSDSIVKLFSDVKGKIKDIPQDDLDAQISKNQLTIFGILILSCILFHQKFSLIITNEGECVLINYGNKPTLEKSIAVEGMFNDVFNTSFAFINVYKLCADFFGDEIVNKDSNLFTGLINPEEQRLLDEIRTGKYKLITIKLTDDSITHIKVTKKDNENVLMIRQLSRLFKSKEFKDIQLTTRNGDIIKYEETDVIKLNKKVIGTE